MASPLQPAGTQVRREGGRAALVAHRLRMRAVDGLDAGSSWDVAHPRAVVGTAPTCDVVLRDPAVSRQHFEILVCEQEYRLHDLDSTNGTYTGGLQVQTAVLAPGAQIRVGDTRLVFEPKKKWVRLKQSQACGFGGLIGKSELMRTVFGMLERIAPTRLSCVLLGETGTGKELAARAVHAASPRRAGRFVVVDCGAISDSLIESELFGHERGAFTGAERARAGAFELADGGTLLLDEIGELALSLQPKLLRAIERREIKRLGAEHPVDVDVRILCATHRSLADMVQRGAFREDLYYRLLEVQVEIPPLRNRPEDLPLLAEQILSEEARRGGRVCRLTERATMRLQRHTWPGNVRELRNVLRRGLALGGGEILDEDVLQLQAGFISPPAPPALDSPADHALPVALAELPLKTARERWNHSLERDYLIALLARCEHDEARAAQAAGVHLKSLQRLLRQHGLRQR